MNKKLIGAIIVAVVSVAIIIGGIVYIAGNIHGKKPADSNSSSVGEMIGNNASKNETSVNPNNNGKPGANVNNSSVSKPAENIKGGEIEVKPSKVKRDEIVEVPIKLEKNPGIVAAQIVLEYDSKVFKYEGYENGDLLEDSDINADNPGIVNYLSTANDVTVDKKDNGTILTVKFSVNKDAKPGKYEIKIDDRTMLCNAAEKIIEPKFADASITVK